MLKQNTSELLKDQRVVREIEKHKWIESEKAGYDIGFDKAAEDWIKRFSSDWMKLNPASKAQKSRFSKAARG